MRRELRPITNPRREARAFILWREAKSVGFRCTISDLAEATGFPWHYVRAIALERGWPVERDDGPVERAHRSQVIRAQPQAVDRFMGRAA